MTDQPLDRYRYENVVWSASGPRGGLVRLVVLGIASFCKRRGDVECWPSLSALEVATDLSRHTILNGIREAVEQGWLEVREGQIGRMRRRGNIYKLTLPTSAHAASVESSPTSARAASVDDPLTSADVALVNEGRPVHETPETSARPVQIVEPSICVEAMEDINEAMRSSEGNPIPHPNLEEEIEMEKLNLGDPQHCEREVQAWHRREAERLAIPRQPGESVEAFEGRVARAYARNPRPSA